MKETFISKAVLAAFLLVLAAQQEAGAAPAPVGNNADPSAPGPFSEIYFQSNAWTVPNTELVYDPAAQTFLKVLHGPKPAAAPRRGQVAAEVPLPPSVDGTYTLVEHLIVSGQAWTDWHEELVADNAQSGYTGWDFSSASYAVNGSGESKSFSYAPGTDLVDFVFDHALPAGSTLQIKNVLKWNGAGSPVTPVSMVEYPSVPVPATAWLFGAGVTALLGTRKRSDA